MHQIKGFTASNSGNYGRTSLVALRGRLRLFVQGDTPKENRGSGPADRRRYGKKCMQTTVPTVTERSVWSIWMWTTMAVSRSARDGAKSTPLNFFIRCDEVEDADGDGGDGKSSKVW